MKRTRLVEIECVSNTRVRHWHSGDRIPYPGMLHDSITDIHIDWQEAIRNELWNLPEGTIVSIKLQIMEPPEPISDDDIWVRTEPHTYKHKRLLSSVVPTLLLFFILFFFSTFPVLSQGQESPPEPSSPAVSFSPLVGAAWCTLRVSQSKSGETRPIPGGGEDPAGDPNDPDTPSNPDPSINDQSTNSGCDVGAGLALYRFKRYPRLSWVAVLGRSTTGTGLAWTAYRPDTSDPDDPDSPDSPSGPVIAVAIGAVVRYDVDGIYVEEVYPALGATLSFMRGRGNDN